jgi:ATP-binding cassette subfamily B protein
MMITMMFQSVSRALASAARVREVIDCEPVIVSGTQDAAPAEVAVAFRGVSFRYPGTVGAPVLQNIDLEVKKGETLAIVGATGSGKSSLVRLIPRFYDAVEGEVLVDGVPVQEYDLKKLRQKIGFVLQKSELFSDTVANNIRWGREDATDEEVRRAAEIAQADGFINGFSEGYDTFVAEKGASLSGGQKQRLSIARALARKPEILILDDATSALDLATEARLRHALRDTLKNSTVILIAQRIASVREADRIAVIENGSIKACAPHEELMATCDTYREIYASQMERGGAANG